MNKIRFENINFSGQKLEKEMSSKGYFIQYGTIGKMEDEASYLDVFKFDGVEEGTKEYDALLADIQAVIDAHDPTPLTQPKTELEILQETVDQLVLDSLGV